MLTSGIKHWAGEALACLRALAVAIGEVARAVEALGKAPGAEVADLRDRLDVLERSRALWEAEVAGKLMEVQQVERNARRAEERTRRALREQQREEPEDAEEVGTLGAANGHLDAGASQGEGVPSVRPAVGVHRPRRGDAARRAKWGL